MIIKTIKKIIRKAINALGYDIIEIKIKKSPGEKDIKMYLDIFGPDSIKKRNFYNIGAGDFFHPAWTNIDYESNWYRRNRKYTLTGINYDLFSFQPIPVTTDSAHIIYSSQTIEHINDDAAQYMFNESYRMLQKGGVCRIIAPNIDLYYRAYTKNDRYFFYWTDWYSKPKEYRRIKLIKPMNEASIGEIFLFAFASSASPLQADGAVEKITDSELKKIFSTMEYEAALNYCTAKCPIEIQRKYPGNHINWWNKDKIFKMLKKTGFNTVYLSGYGQSISPVLRNTSYFDKTHPKISLYVEALKS